MRCVISTFKKFSWFEQLFPRFSQLKSLRFELFLKTQLLKSLRFITYILLALARAYIDITGYIIYILYNKYIVMYSVIRKSIILIIMKLKLFSWKIGTFQYSQFYFRGGVIIGVQSTNSIYCSGLVGRLFGKHSTRAHVKNRINFINIFYCIEAWKIMHLHNRLPTETPWRFLTMFVSYYIFTSPATSKQFLQSRHNRNDFSGQHDLLLKLRLYLNC
jgi:hypothetical protein